MWVLVYVIPDLSCGYGLGELQAYDCFLRCMNHACRYLTSPGGSQAGVLSVVLIAMRDVVTLHSVIVIGGRRAEIHPATDLCRLVACNESHLEIFTHCSYKSITSVNVFFVTSKQFHI